MGKPTISYDVFKRTDGSYAYAAAKPKNTIDAKLLTRKAVDRAGVQISPVIAEAIIASALDVARDEVVEGNRVYLPSNDGNAISFYPIIDNSTLRAGDKDSNGELIQITEESMVNRAGTWKTRMGAQVSNDFGNITKMTHLEYSGVCKELTTPTGNGGNSSTPTGGGNNGSDPDENILG